MFSFSQLRHRDVYVHKCVCTSYPLISFYWRYRMCFFPLIPSTMSSPLSSTQDPHSPPGTCILPTFPAQGCQLFYMVLKNCATLSKEAGGRECRKQGFCSNIMPLSPWRAGLGALYQSRALLLLYHIGQQFSECVRRTSGVPKSLPFSTTCLCDVEFQP